jgi:hypothetical protein
METWRHGIAAVIAAALTLLLICATFLAGAGDLIWAYGRLWLPLGDFGMIGMVPIALLVVLGPSAVWYGLTCAILHLLGERL